MRTTFAFLDDKIENSGKLFDALTNKRVGKTWYYW